MIFKTFLNNRANSLFYKIHNVWRQFSELHSRLANEIISDYSEKAKRSSLKTSGYVYVVELGTANSIASYISENCKGNYVFEANPGPGILTSSLLQNGIKFLRVFESNKDFLPALETLSTIYPSLEIVQEDLMLLPSHEFRICSSNSNFLEKVFQNIPEKLWDDGVPFSVFTIISSKRSIKFLRYLLAMLPIRSSIFAFGRCEFFILTTESEYMYMKAVPKENFSMYRWSTVLYNLFFDIELLKKFSSESLFPLKRGHHHNKLSSTSSDFYLMKLMPKADLFSNIVAQDKLADLYFFVRHHLIKRSALVIPTLECWIPRCGPRLIKEGINVFTRFGDLSPNQILLIFNQFSSWPEYEESTFQEAAQKFFGREQFSYEDDDLINK